MWSKHFCRRNAVSITHCYCVSVFLPQLSGMQIAALYGLWLAWLYHIFPTLSHKRHNFREKVTERKMCVSSFSTTFFSHISHSTKFSARYHKFTKVSMWSTRYSCHILMKTEFPPHIIDNPHRIPSDGAELFHADEQINMCDKANSRFWHFCKRV